MVRVQDRHALIREIPEATADLLAMERLKTAEGLVE